jgi:hypothetical protein
VLDNDRRVLGNRTFWMYARPGETSGLSQRFHYRASRSLRSRLCMQSRPRRPIVSRDQRERILTLSLRHATRGCVGCHEKSNISVPVEARHLALKANPLSALPHGN